MKIPQIRDVKTFVPCSPNGQQESISFYQDFALDYFGFDPSQKTIFDADLVYLDS